MHACKIKTTKAAFYNSALKINLELCYSCIITVNISTYTEQNWGQPGQGTHRSFTFCPV